MMELFHCFGAKPEHRVDARQAAEMLAASGCGYLAVNTHNIAEVTRGDDLPVGYASATLGTVQALLGPESAVQPVLNINHPTTAQEAVARARRAVELTGVQVIKLEVLNEDLTLSNNQEVLAATADLVADGLEVWPLMTADTTTFRAAVQAGARLVRVMGSPIGARRGIDPQWLPAMTELLAESAVPVMLDGGIGSVADVHTALGMGFSSVLVNSCLFAPGADPVRMLRHLREAADGRLSRI